jgi:uncharacterized metal-binding protein
MPESREHLGLAALVAIIAGSFLFLFHGLPYALAFSLPCVLGEVLLSPDNDVPSLSRGSKVWGFLSMVWAILWIPYAWAIPHRCKWSHWPLLGTAGRLLYLALLACPVWMYYQPDPVPFIESYQWHIAVGLAGLETSNTLHFFADHRWI